MVQGNWERRAEMSETRRLEAKQRKQRNGERKVFKAQAQDLMPFLNRNADQLFPRESFTDRQIDRMIHIWTDTPPCSEDGSPLHHRVWEEQHTHKKRNNKHDDDDGNFRRRGRSTSIENDDGAKSAKNTRNNKKKKFHPRSKESPNNINNCSNGEASENSLIHKPKLCRSHFFYGKCNESTRGSGGKKSYSCRFAHYSKHDCTINDALIQAGLRESDQETSISIAKEVVNSSEISYPTSSMAGDNTPIAEAMDMVYYLSFRTEELFAGHFDDEQPPSTSISHVIVDAMAKQSCNIGSIVYFAVGDQLLYDRYRKGIIVEESKLMELGKNKTSTGRKRAAGHRIQSMSLSASILEHILFFLDDSAVASMSRVSRSWNREIGKQSGNLWRHLLQRRSWPIPSLNQGDNEDNLSTLREAFVSHYTAVRDINGIKKGIACLAHRKSMNEFDGSVRLFESVKNSPRKDNCCVGVKIWAENSFLAAYREDCSLRLFDSIEGSESSEERLCRELICHCVDPYENTKKRYCHLVEIALDTDFIGCLLHEETKANYILTILNRENFLIDDDSNNDAMQVIDIRQAVLNFLLSCDVVDHGLLQLHDFLSNDGDLDEVEVLVSQSLVACGHGRFLVEVAIAIPSIDIVDEQDSVDILLFRKIFLFSSSAGAIIWMSDSGPSSTLLGSPDDEFSLSSLKMEENCRHGYKIVSLNCVSPAITSLSVDYGGNLQLSTLIQGTDLVRNEILEDHWSIGLEKRPVAMLEYEVVVVDNLQCEETKTRKSIVTFYPMDDNCGRSTLKRLDLLGDVEVFHLIALRTAHVIALCQVFEPSPEADDVAELDGHWFGQTSTTVVSWQAIVIDVQSRSEIYRTSLADADMDDDVYSFFDDFPIQLAAKGDTVVAGLSSKGVVMTGADVRKARASTTLNREELTTPPKSTKKQKKKKQPKKGGKKDGFARGQKM